jgi:hypothetical protein
MFTPTFGAQGALMIIRKVHDKAGSTGSNKHNI